MKDKVQFLMIARLLWDKGYKEYVSAANTLTKKYNHVEFQIAGAFDNQPSAVNKKLVLEHHKKGYINYLGYTSNVRDIILSASCIVLPSYHEGLSRVLMEAAALSKPIIATDIPGCSEIVDHDFNGFLVKAKDTLSLIEALERFLALDFKRVIEMGENSRKIAEKRFDVSHVIAIYEDILDKI